MIKILLLLVAALLGLAILAWFILREREQRQAAKPESAAPGVLLTGGRKNEP
ncbi:hypothetical protein [Chitinilyticum litopenaei]|uniref:hypothetical protein n=1 Tax=Chitinilyticum litopenaei TaxID=1121276 RepID=UPI00041587ED|nr:hypothetical protein [Chitinilyticum litopenaei]